MPGLGCEVWSEVSGLVLNGDVALSLVFLFLGQFVEVDVTGSVDRIRAGAVVLVWRR